MRSRALCSKPRRWRIRSESAPTASDRPAQQQAADSARGGGSAAGAAAAAAAAGGGEEEATLQRLYLAVVEIKDDDE